jgi:hypothetical protein
MKIKVYLFSKYAKARAHSPCLFCQYLQTEVKGVTNAQTSAADRFLPLRAFKPSSSESADRGRIIIQVIILYEIFENFDLFLQFDWPIGKEISSGWTTLKHRIDNRQK